MNEWNDIEQRLASMTDEERSSLLLELIVALHDENPDQAYHLLRENGLEAYQMDDSDSGLDESMGGDHESGLASAGFGTDEDYD